MKIKFMNIFKNKKYDYPESFGGFEFKKVLFPKYEHRSFKYALYKNGNIYAFAKIWQGRSKNFDYHSLVNEIEVYKRFDNIKKNGELLSSESSNFRVPNLFFYSIQEDRIVLLIEHINGESLKRTGYETLVDHFDRVLFFLRDLSNPFSKSKKIKHKSLKPLPFLYLSFLVISILKHPKQIKVFIRCLLFLCNNFKLIYSLTETRLTHRSLEGQNILKTDTHFYLIDFQFTVLSHPLLDLAQMFTFLPNKKFVGKMLDSKYMNEYYPDQKSRKLLVLLSIYTCLTQLSLSNHLVSKRNMLIEYLLNIFPSEKSSLYEVVSSKIFSVLSFFPFYKKNNLIFCFHSIGQDPWRFSTSVYDFETLIRSLKKKYKIVSLTKLLSLSGEKGYASITFDDGYMDVFKNAYPIMKRYGITGTVFVLGDEKNANRSELDNRLDFMSIKEIKQLKNSGWDVGSHTNTHPNLHEISTRNQIYEISRSKMILEKKLGFEINYFAYPRGKYSSKIVELVSKAGYSYAFTVDGGWSSLKKPFLITRIPMEGKLSQRQFEGLITITGLILSKVFFKFLVYKERYAKTFF